MGQSAVSQIIIVMKIKSINRSLVIIAFLLGIAFTSSATICATIRVHCGDGTGTNGLACGETEDEWVTEAQELANAFCEME